MAEEQDSSQEKTEEPTPRRLSKAREDGNVPKSKELNMSLVMVGGVIAMLMFSSSLGKSMLTVGHIGFELRREDLFDSAMMIAKLEAAAQVAAAALAPILGLLLVSAMLGGILLSGLNFSSKALQPKLSNMDPIKGIKRMFSLNALVEMVKAIAKFAVVAITALVSLWFIANDLLSLYWSDAVVAINDAMTLLGWVSVALACSLLFIAAIDVPYQLWDYNKKLKMTMQEIKDEFKETEGKPEVKRKIRELQMAMAQGRMMSAVPEADVVITNPTHFSVALKYDQSGDGAPIVLAKGVDTIAFKIREVATANGVEIVESPALARAIYHTTDIDAEIPSQLYYAVAQVLAYVFQLQNFRARRGKRPKPLGEITVPEDMQF
ncbi:MAG TPA: flagellar biosynthesis protein FlhB [Pseudomonadales bacterium]|nr:flagellar biosynthesis protein FlhB [Pseudomonadales bacterium]